MAPNCLSTPRSPAYQNAPVVIRSERESELDFSERGVTGFRNYGDRFVLIRASINHAGAAIRITVVEYGIGVRVRTRRAFTLTISVPCRRPRGPPHFPWARPASSGQVVVSVYRPPARVRRDGRNILSRASRDVMDTPNDLRRRRNWIWRDDLQSACLFREHRWSPLRRSRLTSGVFDFSSLTHTHILIKFDRVGAVSFSLGTSNVIWQCNMMYRGQFFDFFSPRPFLLFNIVRELI